MTEFGELVEIVYPYILSSVRGFRALSPESYVYSDQILPTVHPGMLHRVNKMKQTKHQSNSQADAGMERALAVESQFYMANISAGRAGNGGSSVRLWVGNVDCSATAYRVFQPI